ncbi:MAG: penicillin-binding transpeptidase domain-containing protein, partial [Acidobacteriota bacterium]
SLLHWYSVFGFGTAPDLDGRPTAAGQVALPPGEREKALEAIGDWGVVATPVQLLQAYVLIANHGTAWALLTRRARPHRPDPVRRVALKRSTYATILNGLVGCVKSGTCQAAAVPAVHVAGKTGTASALDGSRTTQAWFVGFAPAERPEIALVVFLDRGTGEQNAAPLAGKLLRHYFAAKGKGRRASDRR